MINTNMLDYMVTDIQSHYGVNGVVEDVPGTGANKTLGILEGWRWHSRVWLNAMRVADARDQQIVGFLRTIELDVERGHGPHESRVFDFERLARTTPTPLPSAWYLSR